MRILTRVVLIACLFAPVSACRTEEGFKNIRYEVKSYDRWPIIVFVDSPNIPSPSREYNKYARIRNSGYNESIESSPVRNLKKIADDPNTIKFDVTWYEVVTENAFHAQVSIDLRSLKPDPIQPEFGIVFLRIAGKGDIEAVTYYDELPPLEGGAVRTVLSQMCGKEITISDPEKLAELDRMLKEPMTMEGSAYDAKPEEIPSRCT